MLSTASTVGCPLQLVSLGVSVGFLCSPFIFMLLYIWSREFPTSQVSCTLSPVAASVVWHELSLCVLQLVDCVQLSISGPDPDVARLVCAYLCV